MTQSRCWDAPGSVAAVRCCGRLWWLRRISGFCWNLTSQAIRRYWELAGLPEDKKEWVNLRDVTATNNPMLLVAACAAWEANDTWRRLEEESEQWPLWKYLRKHASRGFIATVQVTT